MEPRRISVERKYDGEYCQIHIDLSKASNNIKIFSKNGKDSTIDRIRLHRALRDSLKLDIVDCKIKRLCILEEELLI
jgi:DNA ligase 4